MLNNPLLSTRKCSLKDEKGMKFTALVLWENVRRKIIWRQVGSNWVTRMKWLPPEVTHASRQRSPRENRRDLSLCFRLWIILSSSSLSLLSRRLGDGNSKISSVYINNSHGLDDDDFYDRNLALFEVRENTTTRRSVEWSASSWRCHERRGKRLPWERSSRGSGTEPPNGGGSPPLEPKRNRRLAAGCR